MTVIGLLISIILGGIALFLITAIVLQALDFHRELKSVKMGIQLQRYLYLRGEAAFRSVELHDFDDGHIRDILYAALSGSIPAILYLTELSNAALGSGGSRINSLTWLYIAERVKSKDQIMEAKRMALVSTVRQGLLPIDTNDEATSVQQGSNFFRLVGTKGE